MKKPEAKKIVNRFLKIFRKILHLEELQIKIHLYTSTSKHKSEKVRKYDDTFGVCMSGPDGDEIIIYYDIHETAEELFGTLIHELIHARVYKLSSLITLHCENAEDIEEELVKDLEQLVRVSILAHDYFKLGN